MYLKIKIFSANYPVISKSKNGVYKLVWSHEIHLKIQGGPYLNFIGQLKFLNNILIICI